MVDHIRKYPWVLELTEYATPSDLITALKPKCEAAEARIRDN
jgi:hypothetical protein